MVTTRFAPSPTGFLHIGGIRTALYCWLFARQHKNGKFVLRIEDTDQERSSKEAVEVIVQGMKWLNLSWDEGPYYQMQRLDRYQKVIESLLTSGYAYRCYCSKEHLKSLRQKQIDNKQKAKYDGRCRYQKAKKTLPFVIRFKTPMVGTLSFYDMVRGTIKVDAKELDDMILARSDGIPTYNFAAVIDDIDMNITHVIRGEDHINNTPKQIYLYNALGHKPPQYAHVSMILGKNGKRLSKRHGAVNIFSFREQGILPQVLLNYLVRLGWSHGNQEIFSINDMIKYFSVDKLQKSSAIFDLEKLEWLNHEYMKIIPFSDVEQELIWHMKRAGLNSEYGPKLVNLWQVQCERVSNLNTLILQSRFFYEDVELNEQAAKKYLLPTIKAPMEMVIEKLNTLSVWDKTYINQVISEVLAKFKLKLSNLAQPIRVAITGNISSPSIDITLTILGKEKTITRLKAALDYILTYH